ncbi:unnamed protein product [Urochloa humidicola]
MAFTTPWSLLLGVGVVFLLLTAAVASHNSQSHVIPTLVYPCNPSIPAPPCTAYLTFLSAPPLYSSPLSVSYLLNASAAAVAAANNIDLAVSPVPDTHLIFVPVPCSCNSKGYYQHSTIYLLQGGDVFGTVADLSLQGLSTSEAIMDQNPSIGPGDLMINDPIVVPLRCSCPSAQQAAAGVRFLVTYIAGDDDDEHAVARRFRVDLQAVRDANHFSQQRNMTEDDAFGFIRTMLIPLKNPPTPDMLASLNPPAPAPAPARSSPPVVPASHCWPRNRRWIDVGVGSGCGVIVSAAIVTLSFLQRRHHRRRRRHGVTSAKDTPLVAAVRHAVNSLAVYTYMELDTATAGFAEERRVSGSSVYRAVIDGQAFAVKRVAGDVRGEVAVLGRVSHSCLVRLSGLCAHRGDTFLVLEFAENGALTDWLHGSNEACLLNWRQRVQVARDVATGLDYLHHFTNPPYVHKNLSSGSVLLDAKLRAKVSGFGLARALAGVGVHATRHVVGTQGYMAPEYLEHGLIGTQMDVFAFGVVLLELLSGKEAVFVVAGTDDGRASSSLLWEAAAEGVVGVGGGDDAWFGLKELMDPRLQGHYPFGLAFTMATLALRCVAREPSARPSMGEALVLVSAVHDSTMDWDPQNYGVSDSMVLGR